MRPFSFRRREPPPDVSADSSDAELLAAVAARSTPALRVLHERHAPWLRARLARRCADPDVVDDALQETFLAVWRSADRFAGGNAAGWMWTIAIRRLVSALRGRGSRWIGAGETERTAPAPVSAPMSASAEDVVLLGIELATGSAAGRPDVWEPLTAVAAAMLGVAIGRASSSAT